MDAVGCIILVIVTSVFFDFAIFSEKVQKQRASVKSEEQRQRIEEAKRSIVCRKCTQKYRPPIKMLRCGHSFCFQCLFESKQEALLRHDFDSGIACPTCRNRTPLHFRRGWQSLPTNIDLQRWATSLGVLGELCKEDSETKSDHIFVDISQAFDVTVVDVFSERFRIFVNYYYNAGGQHNPRIHSVRETGSIHADDTLADLATEIIFDQSFGPSSDSVANFPLSISVNVDENGTPSESVDDSSAIEDFSSRIDDE